MDGFGTLSDFLAAQMWPLIFLGCFLGLIFAVLFFSGNRRHKRLAAERSGEDIDTFVDFLVSYGFDPQIARTTYEYLVNEEDVAFPIRHTDRLDHDLRVSEEEVLRMVSHLLTAFGRVALPGALAMPLITVEDVLRFVQGCPMASASGQHRRASGVHRAASGQFQAVRQFQRKDISGMTAVPPRTGHKPDGEANPMSL